MMVLNTSWKLINFLVLIIINFGLLLPDVVHTNTEFCKQLPYNSVDYTYEYGYLQEAQNVDFLGGHTLDMAKYLVQNLWSHFSSEMITAKRFIATDMNPHEAILWATDSCYQIAWQKKNRFHFLGLVDNTGAQVILAANLGGYESLVKIQLLVRAATGRNQHFLTIRKKVSGANKYAKIFDDLTTPDLVVYGFANTIISAIIYSSPSENLRHVPSDLIAYLKNVDNWVGRLGAFRPVYVLRMKEHKTVWIVSNLYGEDTKWLFQSIVSRRPKRVLITGMVGGIGDRFKVGDFVAPAYWLNSTSLSSLSWVEPLANLSATGVYQKVSTPLVETEKWLKERSNVDLVDVEGGHILIELERSGIKTHIAYVISDQIGIIGADRAQWDDKKRRYKLTEQLCSFLWSLGYDIQSLDIHSLKVYNLNEHGGY